MKKITINLKINKLEGRRLHSLDTHIYNSCHDIISNLLAEHSHLKPIYMKNEESFPPRNSSVREIGLSRKSVNTSELRLGWGVSTATLGQKKISLKLRKQGSYTSIF